MDEWNTSPGTEVVEVKMAVSRAEVDEMATGMVQKVEVAVEVAVYQGAMAAIEAGAGMVAVNGNTLHSHHKHERWCTFAPNFRNAPHTSQSTAMEAAEEVKLVVVVEMVVEMVA